MSLSLFENPELLTVPRRLKQPHAWVEHIPFAFFIVKAAQPKVLVELGVHTGNSFSAFCQAVREAGLHTACYGVDTWRGDEHAGFYDDTIYGELREDIRANYPELGQLLRMTFDEALDSFSDGSIDILHIDGLHTYEAVKNDFDTWLPKLSPRAIVLFHDTTVRTDDFGVWRLWEEVTERYPSFNFRHGFGLGVAAVGTEVPEAVLSFIRNASLHESYQRIFSRLGSSVKWYAESADAGPKLIDLGARASHLEATLADLSQKFADSGLTQQYFTEISIDAGLGYGVEQTVRKAVTGREDWIDFALPKGKSGRIKLVSFKPFLGPVAIHLGRIEVFDAAGGGHLLQGFTSNHLFSENGLYVFDSVPEVTVNIEAIENPTIIRFAVSFVAIGPKFYELLYLRLCKGLEEAGLSFAPQSGSLSLSSSITSHMRTPYRHSGDERTVGGQVSAVGQKSYDEKLLEATLFLHEEVRRRDQTIAQRDQEIAQLKETVLELEQSTARLTAIIENSQKAYADLEEHHARLRAVIEDRDENYQHLEKVSAEMERALIDKDNHFANLEKVSAEMERALIDKDNHFASLEKHCSGLVAIHKNELAAKDAEIAELKQSLEDAMGANGSKEIVPVHPPTLSSTANRRFSWRRFLPGNRAPNFSDQRK